MYRHQVGGAAAASIALWLVAVLAPADSAAQTVRGARHTAVSTSGNRAAATSARATSARGDEGYAAVGQRGSSVTTDEGYATHRATGGVAATDEGAVAAGRRGTVVATDEGYAAAGCRGAVATGEHGTSGARQCGAVTVGNQYNDYDAWRTAAGPGAVIATGTMLYRPPAAAVTVSAGGSNYWYQDNVYYTRVMTGGSVAYQVVAPPAGVVISTLPASCAAVHVGGVAYSQCGGTYYKRVSTGYQVVVLH